MPTCTQCHSELNGPFCSQCGQEHRGKEVTFGGLVRDFFENIFNLESPLLRVIKALLNNPEKVVMGYISGNKGYYFSPGKMLFFSLLFIGLFLSIFKDPNRIFGLNLSVEGMAPQFLFMILLLPFASLFSWMTYYKRGFRFLYHLVSMIYALSLWAILLVFLEALIRLSGLLTVEIELTLFFVYIFLSYGSNAMVFSRNKVWWVYVVNALLHLIISILLFYSTLLVAKQFFPKFIHL